MVVRFCRRTILAGLVSAMSCGMTLPVGAQGAAGATTLPPAVVTAFNRTYPEGALTGGAQQRDGDRTLFRVEGSSKGRRLVLLYDANAALVQTAEQVEEKELPAPVADAMHSHPRAIFVTAMKVTRGKTVQYELTLRGTRKTAMIVLPDGTVVSFK